MPKAKQPSNQNAKAKQLARIAQLLNLEIDDEDLEALSNQLDLIEALEASELHNFPPVLTMDADWHD